MSSNIPAGCSPLATYYKEAKWYEKGRKTAIDTITIHCYVAQVTAEQGCNGFANRAEDSKGSCNYVVGHDGSIGVSVPEPDHSWCSSDWYNDDRAVTFEIASDNYYPYAVTSEAYDAMIRLVTDVCKRNNIKRLVWSTDKNERMNHLNGCNMTVHRDYYAKECPGDYLYERLGAVAAEVNRRLVPVPYIEDFRFTDILSTKIKAAFKANIDSGIGSKCSFGFNIYKYTKDNKGSQIETLYKTSSLSITSSLCSFATDDIFVPNTQYAIELFGRNLTDNSNDFIVLTPKVSFVTTQDYPSNVVNLTIEINDRLAKNKNVSIKFDTPTKWGYWKGNRKGYRVSLIINGEIKACYDDLLNYQSNLEEMSVSIPANTLFKDLSQTDLLNKNFQIGVQPWVLDNANKLVLDSNKISCSKSIYTRHLVDLVDKVFLDVGNKHKRVIVYPPYKY